MNKIVNDKLFELLKAYVEDAEDKYGTGPVHLTWGCRNCNRTWGISISNLEELLDPNFERKFICRECAGNKVFDQMKTEK